MKSFSPVGRIVREWIVGRASAVRFAAVAIASLASLSVVGCDDDASSIGFPSDSLIFQTVSLGPEELAATSAVAAVPNVSNERTDAVVVGHAPDGTTAHALFSLVEYSALLDNVTEGEIVRAELRLRTLGYRFGDTTTRQLDFDVVDFEGVVGPRDQWGLNGFPGKVESGITLGSFSGTYPDTTIVAVPLDKAPLADFLNSYYTLTQQGGSSPPLVNTHRSIALRAKPTGGLIASFLGATLASVADSLRPTLRIVLADTTIDFRLGVSSWITETPSAFPVGDGRISIAAGAPVRTLLKFNIDTIPQDAVIHTAELELTADVALESHGTTGTVRYVVVYVAGDDPLRAGDSLLDSYPSIIGPTPLRGFRRPLDSTQFGNVFYFPDLGATITRWLRNRRTGEISGSSVPNNGLILAMNRTAGSGWPNIESGTVDRVSFYGPDAAEELRPRLKITWSTPSSAR